MRKKLSFPAVVLLLMILALHLSGTLALGAPAVPTADVLPRGSLELNCGYHRGAGSVGLSFGIYEGINLGLRQQIGEGLYGVLKVALLEESEGQPGLAVGGELSLGRRDLYAVLSKQLGRPGFRGHLGLGFSDSLRGMAGVNLMLNPVQIQKNGFNLPTTSLFLEYDGQGLNSGLIAQFSPEFKANLGLTVGKGVSLGMSYRLAF